MAWNGDSRRLAQHDFVKRCPKLFHLELGADSDSHVRRPYRPRAANEHVPGGHCADDILGGPLRV